MTKTEETVREILAFSSPVLEEDIQPDSKITDDLGLDSLDVVEVVMKCEERFGVELPEAQLEQVTTVAELVELIDSHTDGTL